MSELATIIGTGQPAAQSSGMPSWQEMQNMIAQQTQQNNAWSAEQAQLNRDFQLYMSNSAHQREVADLKAAGLNPVLAAGGQGAAVTSGSMANGDQSGNNALVAYMSKMIDSMTQLENQRLNAQNNLAVAEMYNQTSQLVAQISAAAGIQQANINSGASMYAANLNYLNAQEQRLWNQDHPNSLVSAAASLLNGVAGHFQGGSGSGSGSATAFLQSVLGALGSLFKNNRNSASTSSHHGTFLGGST